MGLLHFFDEMTKSLTKAVLTYDNVTVMGDFNIDVKHSGLDFDELDNFCDVFSLRKKKKILTDTSWKIINL